MIRTQISFTEKQMDWLRQEAARTGKSIAQITREAIDRAYPSSERDERVQRIKAIAGKYESDVDDLGENHDTYFVEAIEERIGRVARSDG